MSTIPLKFIYVFFFVCLIWLQRANVWPYLAGRVALWKSHLSYVDTVPDFPLWHVLNMGKCMHVQYTTLTSIFSPGFHRRRAWFSHSHTVAGQHPELVLYPGIQIHHRSSQCVATDDLRNLEQKYRKHFIMIT